MTTPPDAHSPDAPQSSQPTQADAVPAPAAAPALPAKPPAKATAAGAPGATKPIADFKVVGERHDPTSTGGTPLWLWGITFAILILLGTKIYLRNHGSTAEINAPHAEDKILYGTDASRARALLTLARGPFTLEDRKAILPLFDDATPEELSDLAVVVLATHYHLRAVPASLDDIQVVGSSSPITIEYPGGRPPYLAFNEKFDLKVEIERRMAEEEGITLPPAPAAPTGPTPVPTKPGTPSTPPPPVKIPETRPVPPQPLQPAPPAPAAPEPTQHEQAPDENPAPAVPAPGPEKAPEQPAVPAP